MGRTGLAAILCSLGLATFAYGRLMPETTSGFDRYVERAETQMKQIHANSDFLGIDNRPELKSKLRNGEIVVESGLGENGGDVPGGMVQDWIGYIFIPGATIDQVKQMLQDYDDYKNYYKPEVIDSKLVAHSGNDYDIFLRLYKKHVLTVVLNTTYHVHYAMLDPKHMEVITHSTRVAEAKDPDRSYTEERPVGDDTGFLWRMNSYWRFEAGDGGVYGRLRAISLSRDLPPVVGWMIKGFLEMFPKESMMNTLRGTRAAVLNQESASNR